MKQKSIVDCGHLVVQQRFNGEWTIELEEPLNVHKPINGRLPQPNPCTLTESQVREACAILNSYGVKKRRLKTALKEQSARFVTVLKGIRDAAEATKDAITDEQGLVAIDMLLYLIDAKIEEFCPDSACAELTETEECDRIGELETQTETRTKRKMKRLRSIKVDGKTETANKQKKKKKKKKNKQSVL